jgi:hypothetical protein
LVLFGIDLVIQGEGRGDHIDGVEVDDQIIFPVMELELIRALEFLRRAKSAGGNYDDKKENRKTFHVVTNSVRDKKRGSA